MRVDIELTDIFGSLDEKCWKCYQGKVLETGQSCDICQGSGYLLTEAGDLLIDFIRRNRKRIDAKE